jgi:hypothetical protein
LRTQVTASDLDEGIWGAANVLALDTTRLKNSDTD